MRRGKKKSTHDYITARIVQLKDDVRKAKDPHDKKWYWRLIQELKWIQDYDESKGSL